VGHDDDVVALENLYGLDARPSPGGSDDDILDAELLGTSPTASKYVVGFSYAIFTT